MRRRRPDHVRWRNRWPLGDWPALLAILLCALAVAVVVLAFVLPVPTP